MDQDTSEIRHEVEEAREALGETVEALAYKANAPKRLKDQATDKTTTATTKLAHLRDRASERAHRLNEQIQANPKTQAAQRRLTSAKQAINDARNPRPTSPGATPTRQLQPALRLIKRHPTTTAAVAMALTVGIVLGRVTSQR